jgi:hypothetical protein
MEYRPVAQVTHYYNKIGVAVLTLSDTLSVGEAIHISGHTTDFCQMVKSMQIDHRPITEAHPGDDVALKVIDRVRAGDQIFRIAGEDALEYLSKRADASTAYA